MATLLVATGGVLGVLAATVLSIFTGWALAWIFTWIGTIATSARSVQGLSMLILFPLTFLSNAFVPDEGLPNGLQQVAEWNPVSAVVAAVRTLFGNPTAVPDGAAWPLQHPVLSALLWTLLLLAVAIPLTLRRFKARTTG